MKKILAALITSIVILGSSFQTAKTVKEQLIGTWIFESYSYPASFPASAEDSLEANNSYAGQYFVFMPGNKVIMGSRSQKHNANYSLSKDSKEVEINDQKMMVDRLDGTHLSLTIPDHGTMTFKRKI